VKVEEVVLSLKYIPKESSVFTGFSLSHMKFSDEWDVNTRSKFVVLLFSSRTSDCGSHTFLFPEMRYSVYRFQHGVHDQIHADA
jgi:hypothetical protein